MYQILYTYIYEALFIFMLHFYIYTFIKSNSSIKS